MQLNFDKMEGAGNDFVLIDNRQGVVPASGKVGLVTQYCHRRFGVGADGMIFVENDPEFDFAWDFYNSDGSLAEMCGNGARCVARFANRIGAAGENMTFRSLAGPIRAQLTPRGAKVQLTDVALPADSVSIAVGDGQIDLWFLNSGVPHAVILVEDLENVDVTGLGRRIRTHPHFAPSGTNVNFFTPGDDDGITIRTYERGVEDETLACGTGSVAASIAAARFLGKTSPITVTTRSGEELVVHFTFEGDSATKVFLEGGARRAFSGVLDVDFGRSPA